MNIQKAKPLKWTDTRDNSYFYGIQVMIDGKWCGSLNGKEMIKFPTYKEAKKYCEDLVNCQNEQCAHETSKISDDGKYWVCADCNERQSD